MQSVRDLDRFINPRRNLILHAQPQPHTYGSLIFDALLNPDKTVVAEQDFTLPEKPKSRRQISTSP